MRGKKGIKIIAPTPFKKKIEEEKLDPDTKIPTRAVVPETQVTPVSESSEPAPEKDEDTAFVRPELPKAADMLPDAPELALDEYPMSDAAYTALDLFPDFDDKGGE